MSEADRKRWDRRHAADGPAPHLPQPPPPPAFAHVEHVFPTSGRALDLACGRGRATLWMAHRGLQVHAVDVSPVAIDLARELVDRAGLGERCTFAVVDLDDGLPEGPTVDLLLCYLFRDPRLDESMVERLTPGGILAVACLSEVGAGTGAFRARPGDLRDAFGHLDMLDEGESDGLARIIARRTTQPAKGT